MTRGRSARVQTRFRLALLAAAVGLTAIGGTVLATTRQDELAAVRKATAYPRSASPSKFEMGGLCAGLDLHDIIDSIRVVP